MRRFAMAAFVCAAASGLGGCGFSIGSTVGADVRRVEAIEARMEKAEKVLGIQRDGHQ